MEVALPRSRALFLSALVGCGSGDATPSHDRLAGTPPARQWSVSASPVVSIGEEGKPEYEFATIVGIGRLATGSWVAFDRGARALRFYDAAGKYVRRAGRDGDGPGEFRDVHFMRILNGTAIYVYDQRLRRLTEWDPDGKLVKTWTVFTPSTGSVLRPVGPADDQTFVWSNFQIPACVENVVTVDTITYYKLDLPSQTGRTTEVVPAEFQPIARSPGAHRWGSRFNVLETCLPQNIPFVPGPLETVKSGVLYIAERAGITITLHELEGESRFDVQPQIPRRPLARRTIEEYVEQALGAVPRDETGRPLPQNSGMELYAKRLRELPYPDSLPAIDQMVVDALGLIWVRIYTLTIDVLSEWLVFRSDGTEAARIDLPAQLRIVEIGRDYLAGIQQDSLGVQRIVVHTLTR